MEQGGIMQKQLEQNALDQQMRAQEINARIASENAGGLKGMVGGIIGGIGGVLSDERAKTPPNMFEKFATGFTSGMGGGQPEQQDNGQPAQKKNAWERGIEGFSQGMQLSDNRAKVLEGENSALRQALLQASGVPTTPSMRKGAPMSADAAARAKVLPDVTSVQSDGRRAVVRSSHSAPLSYQEQVQLDQRGQPVAPRPMQVASMPPPPPMNLAGMLQSRIRSDEDSKTGGRHMDMEFPEGVEPKAFRYKAEFSDGDPGVHYGVMAQDLEKSREGATVVEEDPATGMKQVDPGRLTMLNTAALSDLERRLRRLEGSG
jgi:hypothetical protein